MKKEIIAGGDIPTPAGPFSPGVQVNNLLFISGQVPRDGKGELAGPGIREQTKVVMDRIGKILRKAGGTFDDLVSVTIYLRSMDDWLEMNEVYAQYFDRKFPARTTVQSYLSYKGTPYGIEIQAIAWIEKCDE